MEKQIWLVEWTREALPDEIPSPQYEETVTTDIIAAGISWFLFKADFDTVDAMVDRTVGGWNISPAPDGEYIDYRGDTFIIKDGEVEVDNGVVYEDA